MMERRRGGNGKGRQFHPSHGYLCWGLGRAFTITWMRSRVRRMRHLRRSGRARQVSSRTWIHAVWSAPTIIHAVAFVAWLVWSR